MKTASQVAHAYCMGSGVREWRCQNEDSHTFACVGLGVAIRARDVEVRDAALREARQGHDENCDVFQRAPDLGPSRKPCNCRCRANGCHAFRTDGKDGETCGAGCWRLSRPTETPPGTQPGGRE